MNTVDAAPDPRAPPVRPAGTVAATAGRYAGAQKGRISGKYLDGEVTLTNNERGADYNITATAVTWQEVTADITTPPPPARGWCATPATTGLRCRSTSPGRRRPIPRRCRSSRAFPDVAQAGCGGA
ncbi:hypothetical protein ILP97_26450 [Amycolatopsis sp. H6(2020)]|nr:hypothetical protein [Amycolatopsis sp. H6(2020)]